MNKMKYIVTFLSIGLSTLVFAQTELTEANKVADMAKTEKATLPKPYHPEDNAKEKIAELIETAQKENKNIILQAGGNWCIWCRRFDLFRQENQELSELVNENYLYYHLNYSRENKNEEVFAKYGNPGEEYGYPVFIILNKNGELLHIQNSAVLEDGNGYSVEKTKEFLTKWTLTN